ncbi:MAG TPA: SRPBCC domain-containing protein [Anaerolineales bacterium]|nr:SRPBCC domain-containing protein [Anaerolineales bacterium]
METKKRNVVVNRVIEAPIDQVWKAWSDSNFVMQWWGPTGFTCPLAEMDFREGGTSLVCMRAPKEFGGQDMYNTWTYQKIVPRERIEFIQHFADKHGNHIDPADMGIPPGVPYEVPHVIAFKALNNTQTELTVTEFGYASDQAHDISKLGMEQCIDKMAMIFAKGRP